MWNFAKKILNIRILSGFWLIREGNDISDIHSKLQDHTVNKSN